MINYLAELNSEQQKAVKTKQGPILILAGAGSGKTRVITYRIAYLIQQKYTKPENILAITFTNKAADEMKTRVLHLLGDCRDIWIRTYHSTCVRILRTSLCSRKDLQELLGVSDNFTIYDEHDQLSLIKECLKELNVDTRYFPPSLAASRINRIKQDLRIPESIDEVIREIYKLYNKKLIEYNALDFGDLIMKAVELLKNDGPTLDYYQNRFKYILVDEYQDTNRAQYILTKLLCGKHRNLCVVGDDDQSIYSWRGAEIRNILDFEKDFPDAVVIKLEQNYRSTKTILEAASAVVSNNEYRKSKVLWCDNEVGEKLEFYAGSDAYTEAAYVARKILESKFKGKNLSSIAVFYRINYQSRIFEDCFIRYQIPYEVVGALKFYDRAEIKDVLAYLKVINNIRDSVSLRRIINVPARKIGYVTLRKLLQYSEMNSIPLYQVLQQVEKVENIDKNTKKRILSFVRMMEGFRKERDKTDLYELVLKIVQDSGYLDSLNVDKSDADYIRRKNVEELLISIREYVKQHPDAGIQDYLADVSLRSDIDEWTGTAERVSLMTLHNAKGLEFDIVFITGFEDGLIPHYKSQDDLRDYEEERRLLYVGITRARKKLFITCARQRETLRGGSLYTDISPFYYEIPEEAWGRSNEPIEP